MIVRRERPGDIDAIRQVHALAFRRADAPDTEPEEVPLLDRLRSDGDLVLPLSLVAVDDGDNVIGSVVCSRATVGARKVAVLGLGPIGVRPDVQFGGIGSAMMHAVVGAADALELPLIGLLGAPSYYHRFGFEHSTRYAIDPPDESWGAHFQIRALAAYRPELNGTFRYAPAFG